MIKIPDAQELAQVKELWNVCFEDDTAWVDWLFNRRVQRHAVLCDVEDGRVTSALQFPQVTVYVRGRQVQGSVLYGVSTSPDYRGRGLMGKLLRHAMRVAYDRGDAVMIHTPQDIPVYSRYAHLVASDTCFLEGIYAGAPDAGDGQATIPELLDCYTAFARIFSGTVARSASQMQLRIEDTLNTAPQSGIAVVRGADGSVAAYGTYYVQNDTVFCEECVYRTEAAGVRLSAVLGSMGLRVRIPYAQELPFGWGTITRKPQGVARVIRLDSLMQTLLLSPQHAYHVQDADLPENNCVIGTGSAREIGAGELTQLLMGYLSNEDFPAYPCFQPDRY